MESSSTLPVSKSSRAATILSCPDRTRSTRIGSAPQLAYLMIPLRQKILGIPSKLGNHFGDREAPVREVVDYVRTLVREALTEVSNLPLTVSDPHWLEKAEDWLEKSEG